MEEIAFDGKTIREERLVKKEIQFMRWSPSGKLLAVCAGTDLTLFDANYRFLRLITGTDGGIFDIAFSPDEEYVGILSMGGYATDRPSPLNLFTISGEKIFTFSGASLLSFSPDGKFMCIGDNMSGKFFLMRVDAEILKWIRGAGIPELSKEQREYYGIEE